MRGGVCVCRGSGGEWESGAGGDSVAASGEGGVGEGDLAGGGHGEDAGGIAWVGAGEVFGGVALAVAVGVGGCGREVGSWLRT